MVPEADSVLIGPRPTRRIGLPIPSLAAQAVVGRGRGAINRNVAVALGVLAVALLIGLLWIFLAVQYGGQ